MQGWVLGLIAVCIFFLFVAGLLLMFFRLMRKTERLMEDSKRLMDEGERLMNQIEMRLHSFDPIFKLVADIGEVVEKHTAQVKRFSEMASELVDFKRNAPASIDEEGEGKKHLVVDLMEWALLGMNLWQKVKKDRR